MKVIGVIPARLASTRLPEKVLRPIAGKTMLEWVWQHVREARSLDRVIIACDNPRVRDHAEQFGAEAILTSVEHPNGTSRIAEVAERIEGDLWINIQADEPLIRPEAIDQLVEGITGVPEVLVGTLCVRREDREGYEDKSVVKVVFDREGYALYFSRAPIPAFRDGKIFYWKHLGIYGYKRNFLLDFVKWEKGTLEETEQLEQLRILERGKKIRVWQTSYDSFSVDTEEDLKKVEQMLRHEVF